MNRVILTTIITFISLFSFAQSAKQDTVIKTVYIFDHTDTIKVPTLLYKGDGNTVKWCSPGWQIVKGRAYIENKQRYWVEDPKVIGALDDKQKSVKPIN